MIQGRKTMGLSIRFSKTGIAVGCIISGMNTSGFIPTSTPENPDGVTPMIEKRVPEIESGCPSTEGVRSKRRVQ